VFLNTPDQLRFVKVGYLIFIFIIFVGWKIPSAKIGIWSAVKSTSSLITNCRTRLRWRTWTYQQLTDCS